MRLPLLLLALAVIPAVLPSVATAAMPVVEAQEIGVDGELYRVVSGRLGDLVEVDPDGDPNVHALVVDVVSPSGTTVRRVVPGTAGREIESHTAVAFDDATSVLYLLWQSRTASGTYTLYFVDFRAESGFTIPMALLSEVDGFDSTPRLGATRSSFRIGTATGTTRTVVRTVLHVVWVEGASGNNEGVLYLPIVLLEDGAVGVAGSLGPATLSSGVVLEGDGSEVPEQLRRTPHLDRGAEASSLTLTMVDANTSRLLTVRLRAIAGEIGHIADVARHVIIGTGAILDPGAKAGVVALPASGLAHVEAAVRSAAVDLQPVIGDFLATSSRVAVEDFGPTPAAAAKARHVIIGTGSRTAGDGVLDDIESSFVFEIPVTTESVTGGLTNLVEVALLAERPLPGGVGPGAEAFSSPTGNSAVVLWREFGAIAFRIAQGEEGWGPVHRLPVSTGAEERSVVDSLRERVTRR
jgi:hypothetical protein